VGEGEFAGLGEADLREFAECDPGALPTPPKAKQPALRTGRSHPKDEPWERRVGDIELIAGGRERSELRGRHLGRNQ
jgi:hypothetical protein